MPTVIPTHDHTVIDTARPFTIDPNTKEIKPGTNNLVLAQRSKNAERFTFTIAGTTIEGHDMTKCNSVMIHFQNIGQDLSQRSIGIYKVEDLAVAGESVTLSWLIGEEATLYAGSLIFSIHFACTDENGKIVYNFPTLTFSRITVGATVWNSETIAKEYPDIIAEFEARIAALEDMQSPTGVVRYTVQSPTHEQQTQARRNIDVEASFYSTTREELSVTLGKENAVPNDVTCKAVWDLYDALMSKHPNRVQKLVWKDADKEWSTEWEGYEPAEGTFVNYEYVVSTGDYNEVKGSFNAIDTDIEKPKYLVSSGIHGFEKASIVSTYRLFRDIVTGHNIPARLRDGCVIHFLPIGNPWSLDNNSRWNDNLYIDPDTGIKTTQGVDINRNFAWNWGKENVSSDKQDNVGTGAESEKETQAIAKWLQENTGAELFIDCHNVSVAYNEIAVVVGLTGSEEYNNRKKIALKGIDRVVQFWKDKIGYADDTIFRTSASMQEGGMSIFYASEVLDIPSIDLELSTYPTGTEEDRENLLPETVAVGAEVIGNVLIEFYEQYSMSEVMEDMSAINAKIDKALSFRVETGVYPVANTLPGTQTVKVPCANGAKMLNFFPDENTLNDILAYGGDGTSSGNPCFVSFTGQMVEKVYSRDNGFVNRGYVKMMKKHLSETKMFSNDWACDCSNEDGFTFSATGALVAGKYNWTAYYWND